MTRLVPSGEIGRTHRQVPTRAEIKSWIGSVHLSHALDCSLPRFRTEPSEVGDGPNNGVVLRCTNGSQGHGVTSNEAPAKGIVMATVGFLAPLGVWCVVVRASMWSRWRRYDTPKPTGKIAHHMVDGQGDSGW